MSTIQAVVFGYDDVLNVPEDWEAWRAERDHLAARFHLTGKALWRHCFRGPAWAMAVRGQLSEAEFWMDRLLPFGLHSEEERRSFVDALFAGRMIHPAMRDLLMQLRGRFRLGVLANIEVPDLAVWLADCHALEDTFDVVIGSADVGLAKPDPAIYARLLQELACRPDEVLYIDNVRPHTATAEALGMATVCFESPRQLASTLVVRGILPAAAPALPVPPEELQPDRRVSGAVPAWKGSESHE